MRSTFLGIILTLSLWIPSGMWKENLIPLGTGIKSLSWARRFLPDSAPQQSVHILVKEDESIATIDADFLCGTIDWWPPEKCDYGMCSWGNASLLNLDISNPLLEKALLALAPFKVRLGGSLQDQIVYAVGTKFGPCTSFVPNSSELFGFSGGCLSMSRWDSLSGFFRRTRSTVAFGLNALYGRNRLTDGGYHGPWDSTNSHEFLQYTVDRGHHVQAWELGNELGGRGVGITISAKQFAEDAIKLRTIITEVYQGARVKAPLLVSPDSFFDEAWYAELFDTVGDRVVDVASRHVYNLGAGKDIHLVDKILNPDYIGKEAHTYAAYQMVLAKHAPYTDAWIGEAGGAYNSGRHLVTDSFVSGFWYVDELGMAAKFNNKAFCRQSLIGGNYGLLSTTTFNPNPDFYSALLWSRLVGNKVLATNLSSSVTHLRTYAHCHKKDQDSITLILLNYCKQTRYDVSLFSPEQLEKQKGRANKRFNSLSRSRLEYHLTADSLDSQVVRLNSQPLAITPDGDLPKLKPRKVPRYQAIMVEPLSIVFVELRDVYFSACTHLVPSHLDHPNHQIL